MNIKESLQFFITSALFNRATESCGLLGEKDGSYEVRMMKNKHPDPKNFFSISPIDYLKFIREFNIVAVLHSHVNGDCSPSEFDKVNADNTMVPFVIYSLPQKQFGVYEPSGHKCNIKELLENL